jgi:predicted O-methyltransferase YrrM
MNGCGESIPMAKSEYASWFRDKEISTDWSSRYFDTWASLLAPRREQTLEVLEVGSWEGRSAIFFLQYLKNCRLTCIDTFRGSREHLEVTRWADALPFIEARFDSNVAEFGQRVTKIKDASTMALARLLTERRCFDVVYLDGSHHSADVLSDAMLAWPMVRDRGIVIFDDYEWSFYADAAATPKPAVDAFLFVQAGRFRELHRGYQVIIEKASG